MWNLRQRLAAASMLLAGATTSLVIPSGPAAAAVPGGMTQRTATSAFDSVQSKSATAFCPAGQFVIGMGSSIFNGGGDVSVEAVVPDVGLTSVTVTAKEVDPTTANWETSAFAQCAPAQAGQVRVVVNDLPSSVSPRTVGAACPTGTNLTSVGHDVGNGFGEVIVNQVVPNGGVGTAATSVEVTAYEDGNYAANWTLSVILICINPVAGQQVITASTVSSAADPQAVNATCPAGQDMTGGAIEVNAVNAADVDELSVDSVLPFSLNGVRIDTSQAIAYVEDPVAGNWNVTSRALCT